MDEAKEEPQEQVRPTVKPSDRARHALSMRGYLVIIVVAILVPVLVFSAVLFVRYYFSELARIEEDLQDDARKLALMVDRDLQGQQFTLQTLSIAHLIAQQNFEGFYQQALRIRGFTGVNILLRDRTGQQLINTRVAWGTPLPRDDVEGDAEVVATKKPYITGLIMGTVAQRPLYTITVPVFDGGEVKYFLHLSLELQRLVDLLHENITPDRIAGIFDRDHIFMARTQRNEFIGKRAPQSFAEQATGQEGFWRGTDLEGKTVRAAYAHSKLAGWSVWVSVPEATVQSSLLGTLWSLAALGAGLIILAMFIAQAVARRLARSTSTLAAQAEALGRGEPISLSNLPVREFKEVEEQIVAASDKRESLERALVQKAVFESEQRFRILVQGVSDYAICMLDPDGCITSWNIGAERITGYTEAEIIGRYFSVFYSEEDVADLPKRALEAAARGKYEGEVWHVRKDGSRFMANVIIEHLRDPEGRLIGFAKITRDITERIQHQEVLERTRAALAQSQKMEALGQLTGGVAHDFNNLLQVIQGGVDMLQRRLQPDAPEAHRIAETVRHGVDRAVGLTQRLLAFGRHQSLAPQPIDANKLVSSMSDLLRRALGESIAIETVLGGGLWQTSADANQLENAIVNLAINARDAMPHGGKLTIETANVFLDESYAAAHAEVVPGQQVMIAVSDTGTGMTADTIAKAFDPFFTTKEPGQGTGLGLSQVYGFIKQSGGHVKIYSEPGAGTTVKLYLPRLIAAEAAEIAAAVHPAPVGTGKETILLVEDDDEVRTFTAELLADLGYRVLVAHDARSGLRVLEDDTAIDLLFTDVGLPGGVNGRQLADEARRRWPTLKVLFTTGYARNAIVHHGRLDPGVELIPKPFTQQEIADKLRHVLESRDPAR